MAGGGGLGGGGGGVRPLLGRPRHPLRRRSEQRLPPQALPWILPCKGTPSSLDGLQQAARNMRFPIYTLN